MRLWRGGRRCRCLAGHCTTPAFRDLERKIGSRQRHQVVMTDDRSIEKRSCRRAVLLQPALSQSDGAVLSRLPPQDQKRLQIGRRGTAKGTAGTSLVLEGHPDPRSAVLTWKGRGAGPTHCQGIGGSFVRRDAYLGRSLGLASRAQYCGLPTCVRGAAGQAPRVPGFPPEVPAARPGLGTSCQKTSSGILALAHAWS